MNISNVPITESISIFTKPWHPSKFELLHMSTTQFNDMLLIDQRRSNLKII